MWDPQYLLMFLQMARFLFLWLSETQVWSLGQEDPLEKAMATHSSTLAWKIPWSEELGRLQSMGLQRVGPDWAISLHFNILLYIYMTHIYMLPRWCSGRESTCQCRRCRRRGLNPWVRKIPWSRKWQPTLVFLSGKFHGQRSLVGYSLWSCKEPDTTEHTCAHTHTHTHIHTHTYVHTH